MYELDCADCWNGFHKKRSANFDIGTFAQIPRYVHICSTYLAILKRLWKTEKVDYVGLCCFVAKYKVFHIKTEIIEKTEKFEYFFSKKPKPKS